MSNYYEQKDAKRIADIITKSKGSKSKAEQLAGNMARAITKADKALRRANAAVAQGHIFLAKIFYVRHGQLTAY